MNNNITIKKEKDSIKIYLNKIFTGSLNAFIVRPGNDNFNKNLDCKITDYDITDKQITITWNNLLEDITINLNLEYKINAYRGTFRAQGKGCAIVKLIWELPEAKNGVPFVPAFMYGLNEGGKSPYATYPQLQNKNDKDLKRPWTTNEWLMRTDRSSHGFTSIISDEFTCALGGKDTCGYINEEIAEKTGLGISNTTPQRISYSLGFANVPYTYSVLAGRNYISRPEGFVDLDKGAVNTNIFLILQTNEKTTNTNATNLIKKAYWILHEEKGNNNTDSIEKAIASIGTALDKYGYNEDAKNFYVTIHNDKKDASRNSNFSSGWTGGLQGAYPLLKAGHLLDNKDWIKHAITVIDNIATNGISPKSGFFNENYNITNDEWNTHGWWYGSLEHPGHTGYINGQICYFMLLSYEYEKTQGNTHSIWFDAAKEVLDHVIRNQKDSGSFGYTYNEENGTILDENGFSGCWFTPAISVLYRITKNEKYLSSANKAMDFYRTFVENFNVYGGPHDIFKSPDEEGILSFIEAARVLHQITNNERFFKDLLMGIDYEFSWKFSYDVVNEINPLKDMKWCSTGGSVTSVNNSHIHPMGSMILESIKYATKLLQDNYYIQRFKDTLNWTLAAYLHYDGEYDWGKKGMINERFCYTDSLLVERYPDGSPASTWFCGHSWAAGSVLAGLTGIFEKK